MKTFDIWVSKKFTFFVLKHVEYVYKDFVDFVRVCAQLFICHAAFNSAFYTGNTQFCARILNEKSAFSPATVVFEK